ncbi:MAG: glycosyltransferase family 39 protein [Myxococcota bacterium]|nr:glycosyltransferase family 39 protein [Myxococcota bacterium]
MSATEEMAHSGKPVGQTSGFAKEEATRLGALFLLAVALRTVVAARAATLFNDGPRFLDTASLMASGAWEQAFRDSYHPLYSFLIQLFSRFTGDPERVGVVISVLAGSLCVLVFYAFLRRIWNVRVATVGAFLLAIHPYAIRFSSSVQSEALYLLLFVGSVALLLRALDRPGFANALFCGVVVGLAYLTRPEGAVVGVVGAMAAGVLWLRRFWPGVTLLRVWVGLLLGFALAALPYVLSLKSVTGVWQLSQKKSILVLMGLMQHQGGYGTELVWTVSERFLWISGFLFLSAVVLVLALRWLARRDWLERAVPPVWFGLSALVLVLAMALLDFSAFWNFLLSLVSTFRPEQVVILLLGILAGALHSGRNSSLLMGLLMTVCLVMLYMLLLNYGYASRRHFLPPLVLLLGYGAVGVLFVADWLGGHGLRSKKGALVAVMAVLALISVPKALRGHRHQEYAGRVVAERLREAPMGVGLLASERSKSAYYANLRWHPLVARRGGYHSVAQLHKSGVRFILLEVEPEESPSVLGASPPGLRLQELDRLTERGRVAYLFKIVESESAP